MKIYHTGLDIISFIFFQAMLRVVLGTEISDVVKLTTNNDLPHCCRSQILSNLLLHLYFIMGGFKIPA